MRDGETLSGSWETSSSLSILQPANNIAPPVSASLSAARNPPHPPRPSFSGGECTECRRTGAEVNSSSSLSKAAASGGQTKGILGVVRRVTGAATRL